MTYTNPYRWLPGFRPVDGDAALRTLVTPYLYAYGPAMPPHFARQLGAPPPRYYAGLFGTLAGGLERVELDGEVGLVGTVMEATATLTVGLSCAAGDRGVRARARLRRRELP